MKRFTEVVVVVCLLIIAIKCIVDEVRYQTAMAKAEKLMERVQNIFPTDGKSTSPPPPPPVASPPPLLAYPPAPMVANKPKKPTPKKEEAWVKQIKESQFNMQLVDIKESPNAERRGR